MASSSRAKDLLNGMQQPIAVGKHDVVELVSLVLINISCLQSFEIKADGSDWSFEFVRNSVDEGIMLLVTPDFTNEEGCVDYETKDDREKEDDAKNEECDFAPVENDPTDVERDSERDE